jgi:uncharacterized protein (DUF302 family)
MLPPFEKMSQNPLYAPMDGLFNLPTRPRQPLERRYLMEKTCPYGFGKSLEIPFEEALAKIRGALEEQGFGILSEIDVNAKFREKLDIDFRPYVILGACNPKLAYQALNTEIDLGLLLPCNVVVYAEYDGKTAVMAMDPVKALNVVANPAMKGIAENVRKLLVQAIARL